MEIKGIGSNIPLPGIRPVAENAPVLPSARNPGQVTANAVNAPTGAEKTGGPEYMFYRRSQPVQGGSPQGAGSSAELERVKEARENIRKSLDSLSRSTGLQFSVDEELGRVVVQVVDPETKEVIKQFPSEDAIALAKSLSKGNGSLHQEKA